MKLLITFLMIAGIGISLAETTYTIQRGDTLSKIAAKHGITLADLQSHNGIKDANKIGLGQKIKIPGQSTRDYTIHTVKKGEFFLSISKKYGVSLENLKKANSKIDPSKIYPGQKIVIPKKGSPAQATKKSDPATATATATATAASTSSSAAPKQQESTPTPQKTESEAPYTKVVITEPISLSDFAKQYKMTIKQVNDVNGWTYEADTVFDTGSVAFVQRR